MQLLPFTSCLLVGASVYPMTPDRDAQVLILIDGDASTSATADIQSAVFSQLPVLSETFAKADYKLEIAFGMSRVESSEWECDAFTELTTTQLLLADMQHMIGQSEYYKWASHGRTYGTIMNALEKVFPARGSDDSVRRVVVFVAEFSSDFGIADPSICSSTNVSADRLRKAIEDARAGFIYSVFSKDSNSQAERQKGVMAATGLTDTVVDGNADASGFDTLEYHLAHLLSPEFIATTSTTTARTALVALQMCMEEVMGC